MKTTTSNGLLRSLALVLASLAAAGGAVAGDRPGRGSYAAFDLGTLGGVRSEGYDINANGDVAGYSYAGGPGSYGFVWRNGMMHKLGAFPGGQGSVAYGLNADGVAVGFADGSVTRVLYYTNVNTGEISSSTVVSNYFLPCRWHGGAIEALDTLRPNDGGFARAINSFGQIAGYTGWSFPDQNNTNIIRLVNRAVRWGPAGVEDLRPGPWSYSLAYGINDRGDAVGSAVNDVHTGGSVHATLFGAMGGAQDLHTLTGPANSIAYGINSAGHVVGAAYNVPTHTFDQPFIWTAADEMQLLRTPFSDPYGQALDINDSGVAVGFLSRFATMWVDAGTTNESLVILQDLLAPGTSMRLQIATAINNAGEITGYTDGPYAHAYLLYPTNSRHRIDGSAQVIGIDLTGLAVTNLLADAAIELFAVRGGALVSRASGWTDANGNFSFLMRAHVDTEYALKIQLADRDSLVAVHDAGRDSNNVAWLRTPAFTVDHDTRADVLMTINANNTDTDQNETAYFLNGAGFTPTLVAPPADGAPGPATDSGAERFAHAAVIYRNTRIAARFAVDRLGLAMPLVPVYAFIPGIWGRHSTNVTVAGDAIVRASYTPATHFESTSVPVGLFISDVASAYNEPFAGISATNPMGALSRTFTFPSAGPPTTNYVWRGRNRPDNREFHEYSHAIMFVSPLSGANHIPGFLWEDLNNNSNLDAGEDKNGNGRLDRLRNHDGLANSDSSDSWVEGWAEFLAGIISAEMLDDREKPRPNEYFSQGSVKNLDDTYRYFNSNDRLRSEENIVAALLWDLYDGATTNEAETLQLPFDLFWQILSANGPALQTFHDVLETFLVYGTNHTFVLSPVDFGTRLIESDLYDDLSLPGSVINHTFDAGEALGAISWNPHFLHRNEPSPPDGSALLLTATDRAGAVLGDVLFDIAIEYDPPLADRNTRYTFAAPGSGPHGIPISLPPHPSRARIKARKSGFAPSAEWVVTSEAYWAAPKGTEDEPVEPYFDRHTFVLGIPGADLAVKILGTGWEAAPATPPWALGNVAPQNGWVNAGNITGHQVVSNGSPGAVISGRAVTTPYGNQFHKFVASSSTTAASFRTVWPDITAALAALPAGRKTFKASMDVFVPSVQDGVAGAYGIIAFHGAAAPWGVLVDPSDHSVNLFLDGAIRVFAVDSFELDTWFNVAVTANYATAQISVDVNGVNIPSLTRTSTGIGLGALTDVDLVAWNYDPSAPPLRAAFSDNFRVSAQVDPETFPVLSISPAPAGAWKLCWSADFRDWIVESTQNLGSGLWRPEPVVPTIVGGAACVTLPVAPPRTFFRLRKP